jgi:hypothetical protein
VPFQCKRRVEFSPLRINSNWSPLGRTALAIGEEAAIPETFTVFSQGQVVPNTDNLQHSGAIHLVFRIWRYVQDTYLSHPQVTDHRIRRLLIHGLGYWDTQEDLARSLPIQGLVCTVTARLSRSGNSVVESVGWGLISQTSPVQSRTATVFPAQVMGLCNDEE